MSIKDPSLQFAAWTADQVLAARETESEGFSPRTRSPRQLARGLLSKQQTKVMDLILTHLYMFYIDGFQLFWHFFFDVYDLHFCFVTRPVIGSIESHDPEGTWLCNQVPAKSLV